MQIDVLKMLLFVFFIMVCCKRFDQEIVQFGLKISIICLL